MTMLTSVSDFLLPSWIQFSVLVAPKRRKNYTKLPSIPLDNLEPGWIFQISKEKTFQRFYLCKQPTGLNQVQEGFYNDSSDKLRQELL